MKITVTVTKITEPFDTVWFAPVTQKSSSVTNTVNFSYKFQNAVINCGSLKGGDAMTFW